MSIVELIEVPQMQDVAISPDGSQVAFELAEADWEQNKRVSHIWRVDIDGENQIQLTNGSTGEEAPRWSPDGSTIVFVAKRGEDEHEQLYLLSNRGGEARPLTHHGSEVSSPAFSADGAHVYFIAPEPKTEEEKKKEEIQDDVFAYDEDFEQKHLFRVAVADGAEERITEGDFSVTSYRLSRDGAHIAHHRAPTPLFDNSDEGEVWLMKSDGKEARQLTRNAVPESGAEVSPDGKWVLFLADSNERFEPYYNDNLFLVPAAGGAHRLLLSDMPHEVGSARWSDDGRSIYFTANTGVRSELFQVEVGSGALTQLTRGDHALGLWRYLPGAGKHVFALDERENAGDIHWLPAAGGTPTQVSRVFDYLAKDFLVPRQESVRWKGADGVEVEGLLYYPLDYQEGKRYPLVVQTHGGPAASDKFGFGRWSEYIPVLAAKGYFIFQPNYRGSTGYGDDVLRDMVGHYFQQAHLDVMAGVDHLIAKGLVDGDRMVKMGWSGGGHMTNKIITHTDRFKAASSGAGAVNWISMYAQSDVRIYRTPWFGGTPWQEDAPIDTYWNHSPLKDIYKVKTPTIILVGEKDVRVPPPQSVELYRALKSNGVPTHLYIAPREPHGWRELRHELFKVNVELDWFETLCMGRDYVWEQAPPTEKEKKEEKAKPTENP
ncbi:MAG: LpqB family beta-propeller domain-containing protein [Vicinamibacteria bacterium]